MSYEIPDTIIDISTNSPTVPDIEFAQSPDRLVVAPSAIQFEVKNSILFGPEVIAVWMVVGTDVYRLTPQQLSPPRLDKYIDIVDGRTGQLAIMEPGEQERILNAMVIGDNGQRTTVNYILSKLGVISRELSTYQLDRLWASPMTRREFLALTCFVSLSCISLAILSACGLGDITTESPTPTDWSTSVPTRETPSSTPEPITNLDELVRYKECWELENPLGVFDRNGVTFIVDTNLLDIELKQEHIEIIYQLIDQVIATQGYLRNQHSICDNYRYAYLGEVFIIRIVEPETESVLPEGAQLPMASTSYDTRCAPQTIEPDTDGCVNTHKLHLPRITDVLVRSTNLLEDLITVRERKTLLVEVINRANAYGAEAISVAISITIDLELLTINPHYRDAALLFGSRYKSNESYPFDICNPTMWGYILYLNQLGVPFRAMLLVVDSPEKRILPDFLKALRDIGYGQVPSPEDPYSDFKLAIMYNKFPGSEFYMEALAED